MAKQMSIIDSIKACKKASLITQFEEVNQELVVWTEVSDVEKLLVSLRDDKKLAFQMLVSICGVDYPQNAHRFEVVYNLLSLRHNARLRVKVKVREGEFIPSVTGVFPVAGWYEREVYDLYGVLFSNHPDLRRILTDYNFVGHPLRKDFPLTGFTEVRYDSTQKRVSYESVSLMQDFRNFDYLSPWSGASETLPGDEKASKG